ncbi:uncharacterized protein LOC121649666 [Melanotaenia boesemani]|uniref:uncharacterized protein LOC121649666 n=1 Tax=Melanotaenia boesemani TaxID=1250792 RepID=UPI001C058E1C|nr:uncharacterized protein LOC121649666 [Melanotaenia boesemani]
MKYTAGLLRVANARLVILMLCLLTGPALKRSAAQALCQPKELIILTKSEVIKTLQSFDKANGDNLGIWHPGFPLLHVNQSSPLQGPNVQCSLHFMTQGLEKIKEDQKTDLNPKDVSLDKLFKETIFRVNMLAICVKSVLGGECSNEPFPPNMPKHTFEKKQWSHTLLKSARDYLAWMQHRFKPTSVKERFKYLSGSQHQL